MNNGSILLLSLCLSAGVALADDQNMSCYDDNAAIGWGTVSGSITGSGEENPVVVTTADELVDALAGTTAKTIYVDGQLEFTGLKSVQKAQNKTVYGLPGAALVNSTHSSEKNESGILALKGCKNIIIRNLTFKGAGAYDIDGNDNFMLQECTYIWVDHCDFQDGVDGNFDCNNASDNICVTWCKFSYQIDPWAGGSGGTDDHRYTNLWGSSDNKTADKGHLKTTFKACHWTDGCRERMPRVRYGAVHIANCLYDSPVANYCVGGGYASNVYVESTHFVDQNNPWKNYATKSGYTDYNVTMVNNLGASDVQKKSGSNDYFVPSENYTMKVFDVDDVQTEVGTYSGATLAVVYDEGVNVVRTCDGQEESGGVETGGDSGRKRTPLSTTSRRMVLLLLQPNAIQSLGSAWRLRSEASTL